MISTETRRRRHDLLDQQMDLEELAAREAAGDFGSYKIKDAAAALGVTPQHINSLVRTGKLRQVDKLIPKDSMADYLGVTPHARRRAAK